VPAEPSHHHSEEKPNNYEHSFFWSFSPFRRRVRIPLGEGDCFYFPPSLARQEMEFGAFLEAPSYPGMPKRVSFYYRSIDTSADRQQAADAEAASTDRTTNRGRSHLSEVD
jgi:hypothetical protein